jgi:hypothetical protein
MISLVHHIFILKELKKLNNILIKNKNLYGGGWSFSIKLLRVGFDNVFKWLL